MKCFSIDHTSDEDHRYWPDGPGNLVTVRYQKITLNPPLYMCFIGSDVADRKMADVHIGSTVT